MCMRARERLVQRKREQRAGEAREQSRHRTGWAGRARVLLHVLLPRRVAQLQAEERSERMARERVVQQVDAKASESASRGQGRRGWDGTGKCRH